MLKLILSLFLTMIAGAGTASAGEYSRVKGLASFEARQTIIPLVYCEGRDCVRSKPYWTMVLTSGSETFEVNQPFAEGSATAPEFVELNGVLVRPGSRLLVEARVDRIGGGHSILSDIRNVNVIMDMDLSSTPFFGWTCNSVGEDRPVYVDVAQVSRSGAYDMRIMSDMGDASHTIRTMASFSDVQLNMDANSIEFAGAAKKVSAELEIDQRAGRVSDLSSVLEITSTLSPINWNYPIKTIVRLTCNRTR